MKKNYFVLALCFLFVMTDLFAQRETVTFVGQNANTAQYVRLTKVVITNQTANWSDTIVYPDTTVILQVGTGIAENVKDDDFGLAPNRPNPFYGHTDVDLQVAEAGMLTMELVDITGRCLNSLSMSSLQPGQHQFSINVTSPGIYFLTARQNGRTSSVKMIAQGGEGSDRIFYTGLSGQSAFNVNLKKAITKAFHYGDVMTFTGYAIIQGKEVASQPVFRKDVVTETIMLPFVSEDEEFVCGKSCAVDVDGNIYHSVLIGEQCWMTENMRATRFTTGIEIELTFGETQSRSVPYRYLPNDDESAVAYYGYLYNWPAAMNMRNSSATVPSGIQGICPDGWHVPSDDEFLLLYDYVASVGDYVCEESDNPERPAIARALCSTTLWREYGRNPCSPGGNAEMGNATGLSIVPAGCYYNYSQGVTTSAYVWTTTERPDTWQDDAYYQHFDFGLSFIQNSSAWKDGGYSVRCLRN